jgi:hypothetical protein
MTSFLYGVGKDQNPNIVFEKLVPNPTENCFIGNSGIKGIVS